MIIVQKGLSILSILHPKHYVESIYDLKPEFFQNNGFKGIVLDIDDTLVEHGDLNIPGHLFDYVKELKEMGLKIAAVSNNKRKRVLPFCKQLDIPFYCFSAKPLKRGYKRAIREMDLNPFEVCTIGDQLFTDILGGNRMKIYTILVRPLSGKKGFTLNIKRHFEKKVLKKYFKNQGI